MAKNIEKFVKIENPQKISEMRLDTVESFPKIPKLDLVDIEFFTEPGITLNIDLGLDQIEGPEE